MAVTAPTTVEVVEEGQLRIEYFPNCGDNTRKFTNLVTNRINSAVAQVRSAVGNNWNSEDADVCQALHDAVLYLVLSRLWQMIVNVMVAYDAEELPPEFVIPENAAATRVFYKSEAEQIIARYEGGTVSTPDAYVGAFVTDGVDTCEHSILGLHY